MTGYQAFAKLGSACWNKMPDKWEKDGFAVYFARDKKNPKTSSGKYLEESLRVQYGEPTLAELALVEKKRKENRKKERKVTVKRKRRVSSKSSTSSKQQMTIRQLFAGRQMVKKSQLRDLEQESKRQKVSASKPSKPKPKSQKPKLSREEKMKLSLRKRRVVLRDTERVLQLPTSAHKKVVILMPPSTSPPSTSPPSSPSPNPQHRRRWIRKGPYKRNEVALQRLKFRHQALLQLSALVPHLHPITETDNMGRIWVWMEYIGESKPDSFRQLTARELLKPNVCVSAVEACAAKYALFHKEAGSSVVQVPTPHSHSLLFIFTPTPQIL